MGLLDTFARERAQRFDPAGLTERPARSALDVNAELAAGLVLDAEHRDFRQADQQFTDA